MHLLGSRGSASLELAILSPAVLLLLSVVIMGGRIQTSGGAVEQAAASGARAASLTRDAVSARAAAGKAVSASLADQGMRCTSTSWDLDAAGFLRAIGASASVAVTVRCEVPLSDLAIPGLKGSRTISARASSPIDAFRARAS